VGLSSDAGACGVALMRRILIDGRGSATGGTGIAKYVRSLVAGLARLGAPEVRVLCFRSEWRAYKALGAKPWPVPSGRLFRPWQIPPVGITHGPNFRVLPRRGAKRVVTVHDVAFLHFPDDYPRAVVDELSTSIAEQESLLHLAICNSAATEADLIAANERYRGRTAVIPLGVDASWFQSPPQNSVERTLRTFGIRRPYLVHLGALVPRKDLGTLVRAWLLLRAENPELALVLAGPDAVGWKSDLKTVGELAHRSGVAAQLHLVGYVNDETSHHLVAGAQAYVLTSKMEGFGLPVLEAMAAGVPVVSSRIPAVQEVAQETVDYAEVGHPEAFAYLVSRALEHPQPERIEAAKARAREFSWLRCAQRTLEHYRRL
jgi:glycosyltransferase involved in cell wall biosynthesis